MIKNIQITLVTMLMAISLSSNAAVITVDDSDIDDITFTWSGFDEFYIQAFGAADDLGSAGSATFADSDSIIEYFGLYTVADIIDASFEFNAGSEVGTPGDITSLIFADISASGAPGGALVGGEVYAYQAGFVYGMGPTIFEQGDTSSFTGSEISVTFISEAGEVSSVPAPASLFLMGVALLGLGLRRKASI